MKIAICDDEKESLEQLHRQLIQVKKVVCINEYSEMRQLQLAMECGEQFDLVIMDIDWGKGKNGIDFASDLCADFPETQIVFVTGYNTRYSQEIFLKPLNLAGFITKPVNLDILTATIENVWRKNQEGRRKILTITHKSRKMRIRFRDIVYMESRGHRVTVYTSNDEFSCYEKLEDIQKRLDSTFIFCHKSFLVNMEEISRIEKDKIILLDGRSIPVSKKRYEAIRTSFFHYLGGTIGLRDFKNEEKYD